ncbi:Phytosulfokines 3 [Cinnamomum micranthum f. kanehirae]|uniref:Phytosulfokine n=1 Tax=Cinnamomum micranthum f. kanehirae TaxID=337451 RepID=A0A3S3MSC0_9MAGN|nr:Phytosulfokines 3 [Cinnamomum micranthum f. kanehirae]
MSKKTIFLAVLLLLFSLTQASRQFPVKTQQGVSDGDEMNKEVNEGCEGVGEEECLMRRTLVAHTDYIYTQSKKDP